MYVDRERWIHCVILQRDGFIASYSRIELELKKQIIETNRLLLIAVYDVSLRLNRQAACTCELCMTTEEAVHLAKSLIAPVALMPELFFIPSTNKQSERVCVHSSVRCSIQHHIISKHLLRTYHLERVFRRPVTVLQQ